MEDLSGGSIQTMSDINEQEEVSKLLNADTRFVEMEEVEKAAKDYMLKQKTEFLVRDSTNNNNLLKELQNEVINEEDEYQQTPKVDESSELVHKMISNFNQMQHNTGGPNPLLQAQMMNELKYRRLYEEERSRNEVLERKMTSLIDKIERHTENNMKIKARFSKDIQNMMREIHQLENENEDLRRNQNQTNPETEMKLEQLERNNLQFEEQVNFYKNELEKVNQQFSQEKRFLEGNNEKANELAFKLENLEVEMNRKNQEIDSYKNMIEQMKTDFHQQKNDSELNLHKLQLNNDHLMNKNEQLEREIGRLKDMLEYEKRSKMMADQKLFDRENDFNRNNFSPKQEPNYSRRNFLINRK